MKKVQKVKTITRQNRYMTISSSSLKGKPWISPVFYAYDDDYNLYWVSSKNARHSKNIKQNPHIAIVIFNSTKGEGEGDAVYIEADVKILMEDKEIEHGMEFYNNRASKPDLMVKNPASVRGGNEWRFYRATPKKVYKSGDKEVKVDGQHVDTRVKINLSSIKDLI
ncbi:MAG TPA: pyridoxamine 5'-phosphate oxidase family protein [Patescibacteria group bacterium]|nr:pyridoxamine 5'-phosphate oxidase family protein [Patescibacteria group bacterium]